MHTLIHTYTYTHIHTWTHIDAYTYTHVHTCMTHAHRDTGIHT